MKYEYLHESDGSLKLPETMEGDLVEITPVPNDRPDQYEVVLDSGIYMYFPPMAWQFTLAHLAPGDHFSLTPHEVYLTNEYKGRDRIKHVDVLREGQKISGFTFGVENIFLYHGPASAT